MPSATLSKRFLILTLNIFFLSIHTNAQKKDEQIAEQKKLEGQIKESKTIVEKIERTSRLANFYFTHKNSTSADSLIDIIFTLATKSGKKEDMFAAYRWSGNAYVSSANREKCISYLQQAVDYAGKEKMVNEEILALLNLARQYTGAARGRDISKANDYFNRIDLNQQDVHDSSRFNYYFRKSAFCFMQEKSLEGIRNAFSAKKFAEKMKTPREIARANQSLADNYYKLKDYEKAIKYYKTAIPYFEQTSDSVSVLNAKYFIGNAWMGLKNYPPAKQIYQEVIDEAEKDKIALIKYRAVMGLWGVYETQKELVKGAEVGRKYKLEDYFLTTGDSAGYYNALGAYAAVDGKRDSADWYYKKSISYTYKSTDKSYTPLISFIYGSYLIRTKRYAEALAPMKVAEFRYDSLRYTQSLLSVFENLDTIYCALQDYKNALEIRGKYYRLRDSLDNQNKKEDVLKAEIAAEEESMANAEGEEKKATERKHDIQYRFIILGGILLLIGLLTIGFFHPPQWLIKGLAFVSFIFIFEFIILLLDSKLHHWFHGAPLPILGIKVLIACLLVPLHHITEKRVIRFLQSKKLHRLKTVFKDEAPKTVQ